MLHVAATFLFNYIFSAYHVRVCHSAGINIQFPSQPDMAIENHITKSHFINMISQLFSVCHFDTFYWMDPMRSH